MVKHNFSKDGVNDSVNQKDNKKKRKINFRDDTLSTDLVHYNLKEYINNQEKQSYSGVCQVYL